MSGIPLREVFRIVPYRRTQSLDAVVGGGGASGAPATGAGAGAAVAADGAGGAVSGPAAAAADGGSTLDRIRASERLRAAREASAPRNSHLGLKTRFSAAQYKRGALGGLLLVWSTAAVLLMARRRETDTPARAAESGFERKLRTAPPWERIYPLADERSFLKTVVRQALMCRALRVLWPYAAIAAVERGDLAVAVERLRDPFLSRHERYFIVSLVENILHHKGVVAYCYTLDEESAGEGMLSGAADTSGADCRAEAPGRPPRSDEEIMGRLFFDPGMRRVPEGVDSPLTRNFWPLLLWAAVDGNWTYTDILSKSANYPPASRLAGRVLGSKQFRDRQILRVVATVLEGTPAGDREVPLIFMHALVNTNRGVYEEERKLHEYRAKIVSLLMENEKNSLKVFDAEAGILAHRAPIPTPPSREANAPLRLVLDYLYTPLNEAEGPNHDGVRKTKFTTVNETQDFHQQSLDSINRAVGRRAGKRSVWLLKPLPHAMRMGMELDAGFFYRFLGNLLPAAFLVGVAAHHIATRGRAPPRTTVTAGLQAIVGASALQVAYFSERAVADLPLIYASPLLSAALGLGLLAPNAAALGWALRTRPWGAVVFALANAVYEKALDPQRFVNAEVTPRLLAAFPAVHNANIAAVAPGKRRPERNPAGAGA